MCVTLTTSSPLENMEKKLYIIDRLNNSKFAKDLTKAREILLAHNHIIIHHVNINVVVFHNLVLQ
jgi:hypothetical protein